MVCCGAKNDLINFSIATSPDYDPNWHHEVVAKELHHIEQYGDRDYKILMVFQPPRHGKSQQCSIDFPAWYLGRNPDKEIITSSYSADLAIDFGSKTRTKVQSAQYRAIFDVELRQDQQAKAKWSTKQGGSYTSVGVGGPITGRGANIAIVDDPIKNREESESQVYRNKTWEWFTSTLFTRLEPNGVVVLIVTRWHVDDLAGRILNDDALAKRCKVISFPALALDQESHRNKGQELWPDRFGYSALKEIKQTIGPYDWASLYQQTPILSENQEFNPEWYKYRTEEHVNQLRTRKFLTIDTAVSQKASADYTGFCDNSVDREGFWNIQAGRFRLSPPELVDFIFTRHKERQYEAIGIEKTVFLDGLKPYLDEEMRRRDIYLPIVELKHNQTSKEIRIRGLIPRYASGSIFHIEHQCKELEEEQMSFPMGLHDDTLDATAYMIQLVENKKENRVVQFTGHKMKV